LGKLRGEAISQIKDWLDDLRIATGLLTRIPVPHPDGAHPPYLARAHRVFPLVGAVIGALVGLVYLALLATGIPPLAAAALALGASALLTGGFHEDGLADLADGFGGGRDKAAKLEIMRDSRLGTYGALILLVSFGAKMAALAALPRSAVVAGLIAAHALARGALPALATIMPGARSDGLATSAGRVDPLVATTAAVLALIVAFVCLPMVTALMAITATALGAVAVAILAKRQIGGITGDVLGAAEQVGETAVLLVLAARLA
jgi:adenosylcobinamide-GDP ribazoletransferase